MPDRPTHTRRATARPLWHGQFALAVCVLLACLVGILSRPVGFLASFWPANAIMLGLLLRHPAWARHASTWIICLLVYIAADVITGSRIDTAFALNIANVAGVWAGWSFLQRQPAPVLAFQRQRSVLVMFAGCVLASLACMALAAIPASQNFHVPLWRSLVMWFASDFYSYLLLLPLFLAAPRSWLWQWNWRRASPSLQQALPLLALVASECISLLIGGPGAIAFIMPAMVWCAIAYGVFPTTVLSLLVCTWKSAALVIATDAFASVPSHLLESTSYRAGLAMLSLAPLAVACAYTLRSQAVLKLHHAVNHDFLTGILARRALLEQGQKLLSRLAEQAQPVAVLMVDIDHFKHINDTYGHAQGDAVLQEFAALARQTLRPEDLLGRLGGEEFAIVLPRTEHAQALQVAQRLCDQVRNYAFDVPHHPALHITLSVGLHAVATVLRHDHVDHMLSKADQALYTAKRSGRNQVRQYGPSLAPSAI